MGEPDLVIQIFSDVPEMNSSFLIVGKNISTTSNAISEAMEYWRRRKIAVSNNTSDANFSIRVKFARIISIHVIEITPI